MWQFKKLSMLLALAVTGLFAGVGCAGDLDEPVDDGTEVSDATTHAPSLNPQDKPPPHNDPAPPAPGQKPGGGKPPQNPGG